MSIISRTLIIVFTSIISGCVTVSPEAQNVMVHSQMSNLLDDCKKLGNVTSSVNNWTQWDASSALQQAEMDLRHKAYEKYGADTVVLLNSDVLTNSTSIQGIAFNCN